MEQSGPNDSRGGRLIGDGRAPIAVVGMGGVFPGAPDLEAFERNLLANVDTTREVPAGRWALDRDEVYAGADEHAADKLYSTRGCFVDDFAFDPAGLRIDAELLSGLDPLYRLVLQAGRGAYASGETGELDPARVGVVLAAIALPTDASSALTRDVLGRSFERALLGARATHGSDAISRQWAWNSHVTSLPAALLAQALGLGGGSYTLDAACASSLYALHLACEELRAGRVDAMLAGGVSRPECLYTQVGFSQLRALSPTGCCRPFDAGADGLIVGEGAGLVLLKRLDDAVRDGDRIHAVIRGIGWSNDVAGSLLAADSEGQLRAMRSAYEQVGWRPEDVDLIECHGTGTPVGDAAEIRSLQALWEEATWQPRQCVIGSVKSMIGHLLTGAGIAGLIKTILALEAKQLPPTANFEQPAPDSELNESAFRVISESEPWLRRGEDTPRRAAVSAFGFGGINAHLLLDEWDSASREADGAGCDVVRVVPVGTYPRASQTPAGSRCHRGSRIGSSESVPIAIVGMETRFGRLGSLREFQEAVLSGSSAIEPRPGDRWRGCDELAGEMLDGRALPGAYLDTLSIEVGRFRLPPAEIPEVLPQQLLMLQVVDRAFIDAGVLSRERRPRAGVMIGIGLDLNTSNFHQRWVLADRAREWAEQLGLDLNAAELARWIEALRAAAGPALNAGRVQGALGGMIASRIAREYSLGGPSFAVSAEEASGIRALEIAVRALQRRELDLTVAGAVDLAGDVRSVLARHARRPYSRGGQARPFDAAADGTVVGEGAVALVLKRLPDALAAGDRVYAVVRGLGAAGGSVDEGASRAVYRAALERAYDDADIEPGSISLVETHGSGDPDEDRAEAAALLEFFGVAGGEPCALGSVKPNIGHTGAAAGLASVAKSALCLYHEILPPLVGYEQSGGVDWGGAFHMPRSAGHWLRDRSDGPRRAGVSTMTLDGNCAHVVLEGVEHEPEYGVIERRQPLGSRRTAVFAVEGGDVAALLVGLDALDVFLGEQSGDVERLARVWHERRGSDSSARRALAIVAESAEQLGAKAARARHALENHPGEAIDGDGIHYTPQPLGLTGELAFVFPGSGNHYLGMGGDVGAQWPEILSALDAGTDRLKSQLMPRWYAPWRSSWSAGWEAEAGAALQDDHLRMMMGQVSHGIVMSDLLRALGIVPRAAIGYSLGETTSLFALRAWRDRDEMFRRMTESPLFRSELAGACEAARRTWGLGSEVAVDWRVAVVNRSARQVRPAVARHPHAYLLIANTPDECVIGGRGEQVRAVIEGLGCEAVYLDGAATVHCKIVSAVEDAYRELHLLETTPPDDVRFYSVAWGRAYELDRASAADSILAQALHGFDFPATIEQAYRDGVRIFVEPGPRASCCRMIDRILESRPHMARPACISGQDGVETVLNLVAALVAQRALSDLTPLYGGQTCVAAHRGAELEGERRACVEVPVGGAAPRPSLPPDGRHGGRPLRGEEASSESPDVILRQPTGRVTARAEARGSSVLPNHVPQFSPCEADPPSLPAYEGSQSGDLLVHSLGDSLADMVARSGAAEARAHEAFLNFSRQATEAMGGTIAFQARLIELLGGDAGAVAVPVKDATPDVAYSRELCMEFAVGSVARVLGAEFAEVDSYPVRVRLPDEPLMLVDRIMSVTAEKRSLTGGNVVTEHDVHPNAWYLDGDRCPTAITVEAGQADLFLCSYLGIDLAVKGTRSYRLLDAAVTFYRGLPRPGEVVRYDITIDKFVRQGDVYLFFFRFDGTIDGQPLLTMREGCAGFFTTQEIKDSGGIVLTPEERAPAEGKLPEDWRELVPMGRESYSERQIDALRDGDLAGCFGKLFANLPLDDPPRIPGGKMRLVHRVTELDPAGGRYGLGLIRAEADIHADDWFLTCHFVDDMVMPGTLMYECCLHTLRVFLLRMGWVGEHGEVCYEPVPGVTSALRCRGPVTVDTKVVTYEVHMKEFGYGPEPYVITDAFMYGDGEMIVRFTDMALKITGLSRAKIEEVWDGRGAVVPVGAGVPEPIVKPAIFDNKSILAFAIGKPSAAFGERYEVFDRQRRIARLPGPPYKFLDRITEVHARAWELEPGGWIEGQYDVPPDEWYFRANRQPSMPFAVLLEIALQPCGWLAAYMGSALRSDKDLRFRNLGGTATLHEEVFADAGLLTTRVRLTNVSQAGGMIVQDFDMQIWRGGRIVYDGTTSFGFFSQEALDQQVGIRDANQRLHAPTDGEVARGRSFALETYAPLTPDDDNQTPGPAAALPGRALRMNDTVELLVADGGAHGLGFARAVKVVDPEEWFFAAHFYQDPVCPGSLGLEAFLQALKVLALERWGSAVEKTHRFEPILVGAPHTWVYRGQIIPANRRVEVEATVTEIREGATPEMVASGFLKVDGLPIYEMIDFGLRLVPVR